jgi:hypothetical protein
MKKRRNRVASHSLRQRVNGRSIRRWRTGKLAIPKRSKRLFVWVTPPKKR